MLNRESSHPAEKVHRKKASLLDAIGDPKRMNSPSLLEEIALVTKDKNQQKPLKSKRRKFTTAIEPELINFLRKHCIDEEIDVCEWFEDRIRELMAKKAKEVGK